MLFTKNITYSISNITDKKNLEISYQGNTKTIKLPDGKIITITFEGNERLIDYSDGRKIKLIKKPTGTLFSDLTKGDAQETLLPCYRRSQNNWLKICTYCTDCEICVCVCPESAIEVIDGVVTLVKDCSEWECYNCLMECPIEAIRPL
jgi:ferredoxin